MERDEHAIIFWIQGISILSKLMYSIHNIMQCFPVLNEHDGELAERVSCFLHETLLGFIDLSYQSCVTPSPVHHILYQYRVKSDLA